MNDGFAERLPPEMFLSELSRPADACLAPDTMLETRSMPPAPLLSLTDAVTRLPGRRIGPFNLEVRAGERIAILGPSGAGKSTLLKLMAGERAPHEGQVTLQRRPLPRWALPELARRRAVLPQSHAVAFGLPVELVVALGRVAREPDPDQARIVAQALALAKAGHLIGRRFDTLSGGEQARVQLARVLAQLWDEQACLLLVDEPLAALDPGLQFELMDALLAFCAARQHALAAVLHDLNQALASFQRLWLLREGGLMADIVSSRAAVAPLEALYGIALRCVEGVEGSLAVVPMRRTPTSATAATQAAERADA